MASMIQCHCEWCKKLFSARVADRKRGWARFCSKGCKAAQQTKRTGYAGPTFDLEEMDSNWCHPFEEDAFRP